MNIIDLSHPIRPKMPVFPGTEPPVIEESCSLAEHGFREKRLSLYSHTGTHIDAPKHLLRDGPALDEFPVSHFCGTACIYYHGSGKGSKITMEDMQPLADKIAIADYLLVCTNWDRFWGSDTYFADFPVLDLELARWLVAQDLKGIGLDVISADHMESSSYPVHKILLEANIVIVENLCNLQKIGVGVVQFSCLPLAIEKADGSPVRAIAMVE